MIYLSSGIWAKFLPNCMCCSGDFSTSGSKLVQECRDSSDISLVAISVSRDQRATVSRKAQERLLDLLAMAVKVKFCLCPLRCDCHVVSRL